MGLNFRKSFGSGPFRVTLSKKGVSASVGVKGARISKSTTGRTTSTLSIPGTGLYYTKSRTSAKKNLNSNIVKNKEENYNMFTKFQMNEKELDLFKFIFDNLEKLGNEFTIHDVSVLGHISSSTCYSNLYNKGLLLKPSRGKYSLNISLLEQLAEEQKLKEEERICKENESIKRLKMQKEKNKKIWKKRCKILAIPCTILGLLLWFCELTDGPIITIIGILMLWHGFRKK